MTDPGSINILPLNLLENFNSQGLHQPNLNLGLSLGASSSSTNDAPVPQNIVEVSPPTVRMFSLNGRNYTIFYSGDEDLEAEIMKIKSRVYAMHRAMAKKRFKERLQRIPEEEEELDEDEVMSPVIGEIRHNPGLEVATRSMAYNRAKAMKKAKQEHPNVARSTIVPPQYPQASWPELNENGKSPMIETLRADPSKRARVYTSNFSTPVPAPAPATVVGPPQQQQPAGQVMNKMPTVTAMGPAGNKIEGILFKYMPGYVSIVCVCHGRFFSPAAFVSHAGWFFVPDPMKHIKVLYGS